MGPGAFNGPVRNPFIVMNVSTPRAEHELMSLQRPAGDTTRELDKAWESDSYEDEEEDYDDDSNSDGENTVI
jgi:hypothetical protein